MGLFIFSIIYWLVLILASIVIFSGALILWIFTSWFDKRLWLQHQYSCWWASIFLWMNPFWPTRIEGREKIDDSKVYVAVSNHQSMLDIMVIHSLFFHFKWVSKKENLYIPFIGWNMILNKYVVLDRASRKSFARMMRDCRRHMANGSSIMIFPEGTRSEDGNMRSFKDGAFRLALQMKCPVLPIVLDGTGESIPKKGFIINKKTPIRVRVLDPVMPDEYQGMDSRELSNRTREAMESALNELRQTGSDMLSAEPVSGNPV
jgi:1-acyl-sn-glycerol-3-phosphate acyltransferase